MTILKMLNLLMEGMNRSLILDCQHSNKSVLAIANLVLIVTNFQKNITKNQLKVIFKICANPPIRIKNFTRVNKFKFTKLISLSNSKIFLSRTTEEQLRTFKKTSKIKFRAKILSFKAKTYLILKEPLTGVLQNVNKKVASLRAIKEKEILKHMKHKTKTKKQDKSHQNGVLKPLDIKSRIRFDPLSF